jgi:hypothetical protein
MMRSRKQRGNLTLRKPAAEKAPAGDQSCSNSASNVTTVAQWKMMQSVALLNFPVINVICGPKSQRPAPFQHHAPQRIPHYTTRKMTRPDQKIEERWTLDALLSILNITPEIDVGERPDFVLTVSGKTIGVELTRYRSRGTVTGTGFGLRQIESEWEDHLQQTSRKFRTVQTDISNVSVGLMFCSAVPARKKHLEFMTEIGDFIRSRDGEITAKRTRFLPHQFTSPLMKKYLQTLYLRRSEFAAWYSNITAGWVTRPDSTLAGIVADQAAEAAAYRHTDERWLVIQCSHRISETVLVGGIDDLNAVGDLTNELHNGPFSRVYLITNSGEFEWDRSIGWRNLRSDPSRQKRSTIDEEPKTQ